MKLNIALSLIALSLILPFSTQAEEPQRATPIKEKPVFNTAKEKMEEKRLEVKENLQEKRELIVETRCELVEKKLSTRINNFEVRKDDHIKRYENVIDRLTKLSAKLKENGYDTTDLDQHLEEFAVKIKTYQTDKLAFINKLKEAQQYVCGDSDGKYKQLLEEAKVLQETVMKDMREIKDYFENVIKEDIRKIKAQKKTTDSEKEEN